MTHRFPSGFVLFLCLFGFSIGAPARAEPPPESTASWARFRGPDSSGVTTGTGAFTDLDQVGLEVVWKKAIGSGYSAIAVADGKAVTMFSEGASDVLAAFDVDDGERLWTVPVAELYQGHDGSHDGPLATPVIADGRVFALGPRGQLLAVGLDSGAKVWEVDLVAEHGAVAPSYGFSTSPIVEAGTLVVELGGEGTAVVGFDPATGEKRWAVGTDAVAYQSPIRWSWNGSPAVVAAGNEKLIAVDPARGELLWEHPHGGGGARGMASLMPVPAGEGRLFLAFKDESSTVVELRPEGEGVVVETLWEDRSIRNSYNVPVYHDGHIYAYSSRFLTCVDAATGESVWRSRQPGDGFLIAVDGNLVISTKAGGLHVVEATPEGYRERAGIQLFEDHAWSAPSFVEGSLFVRSLGEIARVDLRAASGGPASEQRLADGSAFGELLSRVHAAPEAQRASLVEEFMAEQKSFPIVEGDSRVHFVYRGEAQDVALAGDMFGARREEPMTRIPGTNLFYYSLDLAPGMRLNYLFIKDFEEIVDPLNPRRTSTILLGKDMEMAFTGQEMAMSWLAMPGWQTPGHLAKAPTERKGAIESHRLENEAVPAGIGVDVYLPKGYDPDRPEGYGVAYYHGAAARERGAVPNTLDHLIGTSVAPVITVFVDLQAPGSVYGKLFVEQVVPFVDKTYNTLAEPGGRANLGSAFDGFAAMTITLSNPDLFSKVATQSMFLFTQMEGVLDPLLESAAEAPPKVYMDWGAFDLRNPHEAWDMGEANRELQERLRKLGFEVVGGEAADGTGWSSWKNRTNKMFQALFPLDS